MSRLLLSRTSAVLAAVVTLVIILGCMTSVREDVIAPSAEPPASYLPGDSILEQTGRGSVGEHGVLDVYYPVPYIGPPQLTVSSALDDVIILDQKRDHFRVKNTESIGRTFEWEAKGIRVMLNAPPTPVAGPPPDATPLHRLPAEPVPISQP